jgi:hypothetical protein
MFMNSPEIGLTKKKHIISKPEKRGCTSEKDVPEETKNKHKQEFMAWAYIENKINANKSK